MLLTIHPVCDTLCDTKNEIGENIGIMANFDYRMAFDARGRRVRGLWLRNGGYYAQLRLGGDSATKMHLHGAATVPQAIEAMQALKKQRRDGVLGGKRRSPTAGFGVCADAYLAQTKELGTKRLATVRRESSSLNSLVKFFGQRPISGITEQDVMEYASSRKASGVSGRAVDIDIISLRHVFKYAKRAGYALGCPFTVWESLSDGPRRIRLISREEIDAMRAAAVAHIDRGQQFADYLELAACSGGREQEVIRLRWSLNVNWERRLLGFGQDGLSKFGKSRWLPMNQRLEDLLKTMRLRAGASDWLFPSRYSDDKCVTHYRKDLGRVMKLAGVTEFGFHHLRHYFISHAVMSGVDFRTLADWAGHADGGCLIGKIYSHLSEQHSSLQASKVVL